MIVEFPHVWIFFLSFQLPSHLWDIHQKHRPIKTWHSQLLICLSFFPTVATHSCEIWNIFYEIFSVDILKTSVLYRPYRVLISFQLRLGRFATSNSYSWAGTMNKLWRLNKETGSPIGLKAILISFSFPSLVRILARLEVALCVGPAMYTTSACTSWHCPGKIWSLNAENGKLTSHRWEY